MIQSASAMPGTVGQSTRVDVSTSGPRSNAVRQVEWPSQFFRTEVRASEKLGNSDKWLNRNDSDICSNSHGSQHLHSGYPVPGTGPGALHTQLTFFPF